MASEDKDFFEHGGVSFAGMLRGIYQTYVRHNRTVGGSTLSQQTAKAIMASTEGEGSVRVRSGWAGVRRKAREFILTRRLEANFNKEHILWLYLNEVYFGHHSYGVQAAAENYFRKNVWELTLPEIALIAGLPQAPSSYSPFAHPERAKNRRSYVLRRMFEEGMITRREREQADAAEIQVYPVQDIFRETSPYVTEHVRRDLVARYGNERLLNDGLKVYATVDLERERDAVAATIKGVIEADKRQGYRGPLLHLAQKDWDDFAKKEQAFLEGDGKHDEVIAALVTGLEKDGKGATLRVGLAGWAASASTPPGGRASPIPRSIPSTPRSPPCAAYWRPATWCWCARPTTEPALPATGGARRAEHRRRSGRWSRSPSCRAP